MAWTYSDYRQQGTLNAQIARLDLHIQEVTDAITADVSSDGKSMSSGNLVTLRDSLTKERERMAGMPGASGVGIGGGMTIARLTMRPGR